MTSPLLTLGVTGFGQRKAAVIISNNGSDISKDITERVGRGVTVMHGKGALTNQDEEIPYTVITL